MLIPSGASAVLGVDIDAFAKTSTGKAVLPALRSDLHLAQALEILDDCELSLERSYALTIARDPHGGRMAIIQARGIGTEPTLACLANEVRARQGGAEPWLRETGSCHPSLALADGSRAWVINDYTVVWAAGSLLEPSAERLEGHEALALPPGLAAEFARLDRSGHLWLAAQLDDEDRAAIPAPWAPMTRSLTAAIDLSDGVDAVFSLSTDDVASTASVRELVLVGFAQLAERLDAFGVTHHVRERAGVGIVDGVVAAQLSFDTREVQAIRREIGEHIRGRGPL